MSYLIESMYIVITVEFVSVPIALDPSNIYTGI